MIRPTQGELECKLPVYLPRSILATDVQAEREINNATIAVRTTSVLDWQFRLLREEMVAPMRKGFDSFQEATQDGLNARMVGLSLTKPQPSILMEVALPPSHKANRCKNLKERVAFWTSSRSLSLHTSYLVAVNGKPFGFVTIVYRDPDVLARHSVVGVWPDDSSVSGLSNLLAMVQWDNKKTNGYDTKLVQIGGALFAFEPVLSCLQKMDNIPLTDELILNKPSLPTEYINIDKALIELESSNVTYDEHQLNAMKLAFKNRVSITQGPPGTGKTFVGVKLLEIIYKLTNEVILCVCYTNHALDDFMADLLNAGLTSMVRIGGRSKDERLEPYSLHSVVRRHGGNHSAVQKQRWAVASEQKIQIESQIEELVKKLEIFHSAQWSEMECYLEEHDKDAWSQLCILPEDVEDGIGFHVIHKNRSLTYDALWKVWLNGGQREEVPLSNTHGALTIVRSMRHDIWALSKTERQQMKQKWVVHRSSDLREEIADALLEYRIASRMLNDLRHVNDEAALKSVRIIGCTTTGAAKYKHLIDSVKPGVVIIEEAGEVLEAHVLTCLHESIKHLIMIGDHKQLRPRIETYELSVACPSTNYNLNCSLFERLALSGKFGSACLAVQHRMHPDIAKFIRPTYAELSNAPKTEQHPPVRGVTSRVVFINHDKLEDTHAGMKQDM
eukprot:Lankesteria_metandrocarpae@DN4270_c0_g1_i1.p1